MNELDEKLLTGTESEEFLPPVKSRPTLNAKEFLVRTSAQELRDIFGVTPKEEPRVLPPLPENKPKVVPAEPATLTVKEKPRHLIIKFIGQLPLIILLIIIILYFWGGIVLGEIQLPL